MYALKTLLVTTLSAASLATAGAALAGEAGVAEKAMAEAPKAVDIVDTAIAAGDFTTLVAAVEAAGLVETLKGDGPFTVFAPTDTAFAALPEGTVADLLKPENKEKLAAILTYHVLPGKVLSTDLGGEMSVPTVEGSNVAIVAGEAGVSVDGASVTTADIMTSNGVIHVIDAVILPTAEESR